ncbi:MAG: DbpA RNA binding domain-containing protein [Spirochaetales bacterium]|nr:DbpA RNA binding domain-containing protein [Spirochaetales bacterium]
MDKVTAALELSGFKNQTAFQKQVLPAIFSGRNLIAETHQAKGIVITFILPLLIRQFQKINSPSALILTDSLSSVSRIENNYLLINKLNNFKTSFTALGSDKNPGNDIPQFNKQPSIIVGITSRIIDHIRRNNINPKNIDTLIIDVPEKPSQSGFEQNVLYIVSKLNKKTQIQIFVNQINQSEELEKILYRPKILLYTDREKLGIIRQGDLAVDKEKLELRIKTIIEDIKANPDELAEYRRLFKKNVPFFLRSYFAAKLLKDSEGSVFKSTRRVPAGNMKTLFVSIGRRRKVHPRDLMKLFQKALDIKSTEIGPIKVLDNYSFIDLNEKLCTKAVEQMNEMEYRGRKISVDFAKKRT